VAQTEGDDAGILMGKMMGVGLVTGKSKRIRKQVRAGARAEIGLGRTKENENACFEFFAAALNLSTKFKFK
jgi:hypothetical protein